MISLTRDEREKAYQNIRQHANVFAGSFIELARECRQTDGIENVRLEFGTGCVTKRIVSPVNKALSSIVVTLPDPLTTLHLDRLDVHDPAFYATIAMSIHETAHLVFGSLDRVPETTDNYHKLAYNALTDICDESALCAGLTPGARPALGVCNNLLYTQCVQPLIVSGKEPKSVVVAKLITLAYGLYVPDMNRVSYYLNGNPAAGMAMKSLIGPRHLEVEDICIRVKCCTESDTQIDDEDMRVPQIIARRNSRTWKVLSDCALDLADILRELDEQQPPNEGGTPPPPSPEGSGLPDSKQQSNHTPADIPENAKQQAMNALIAELKKEMGKPELTVQEGGNQRVDNKLVLRSPRRFNQYRSAMRRLMKQLLRSRKLVPCIPAPRGSIVRDVQRAYTDGRVFLRRDEVESTNAAIAFILDCSGSTQPFVEKMLMFCGCLAQGAQEAGASVACWLFGTDYMPIATRMLYRIAPPDFGGTVLSPVYRESLTWLDQHDSHYQKRVCVILTDGQPYDDDKPSIKELHDSHPSVTTLVGCIEGIDVETFVRETMPRATPFTVRKDFAVSALLIARRIERVKPFTRQ